MDPHTHSPSSLIDRWRSFRAHTGFKLRQRWKWHRPVRSLGAQHPFFEQFQREIGGFLKGALPADGSPLWTPKPGSVWKVLDIGARDFSLAPALDRFLQSQQVEAEIHGIELDAYRRLRNLRTRWDYAQYFKTQVRRGFYHPADWLGWSEHCDGIFMLNPFVTPEPLLRWGLGLGHFQPQAWFDHAAKLLPPDGWLLTSAPNHAEAQRAAQHATHAGFRLIRGWKWVPVPQGVQRQARLGQLWLRKPV